MCIEGRPKIYATRIQNIANILFLDIVHDISPSVKTLTALEFEGDGQEMMIINGNGEIVEERLNYDLPGMLKQIGMM
jgi:hypothetical protein